MAEPLTRQYDLIADGRFLPGGSLEPEWLRHFMVLFFIELSTRRIQIAGIASNPHGSMMWFGDSGGKHGTIIGETDEMGLRGVVARYPMRDFHATILQAMGLDQNRLWFLHNGRNEKLYRLGR